MASINSVHLLGNLTRDPEVRYTPKGSAVCDISLAINRVWYDDQDQKREEVDFIDVTVFGKTAENCGKFLAKGLRLHVEGRLKQEQWEDKTTGQKKSKVKVIADKVTFIDFREDGTREGQKQASQAAESRQPAQAQRAAQAPAAKPAQAGYGRPAQAARPSRTVQHPEPTPDDGTDEIPW
jgi:single-strand DNA-binding protein